MAFRLHQVNKKTGITYVYESTSYWDKEKKQSRNKQTCIGKLDPISKEFIPSKRLKPEQAAARDPAVRASASIVGPLLILDSITVKWGLDKLLKSCFPNDYQQIQMMAYYLVAHGGPLSHCEVWSKSHAPNLAGSLASQRITETLCAITTDEKQTFCTKWMDQILESDYLCYDITSISSYSELNEYIKYAHNRDREKLPQLNLAMLFGHKSRLPIYFHQLPGNITDVTALPNLLKTFKFMEKRTLNYVMDKGFYSKKNIDSLVGMRQKFTVSLPMSNKWVQQAIDDIYEDIYGPQGYQRIDNETLYVNSRLHPWGEDNRRCYLHLYYNAYARAVAVDRFKMRASGLVKKYTVRELLQEMETLSKIKYSGKYGHILTELTKPQREILTCLNLGLPSKT